jgi:hypothetical protein
MVETHSLNASRISVLSTVIALGMPGRDVIQPLHRGWGKIAEKMLLPNGASGAAVKDVQTVGRLQGRSSST